MIRGEWHKLPLLCHSLAEGLCNVLECLVCHSLAEGLCNVLECFVYHSLAEGLCKVLECLVCHSLAEGLCNMLGCLFVFFFVQYFARRIIRTNPTSTSRTA